MIEDGFLTKMSFSSLLWLNILRIVTDTTIAMVVLVKRKSELAELLFIDVNEGFIQKVDLGYILVSPIIKLRLYISLSYN